MEEESEGMVVEGEGMAVSHGGGEGGRRKKKRMKWNE